MGVEPLPSFDLHSPGEIRLLLASRLRDVRVSLGFKQSTLAARAGVTLPTLRRFEQSGEISLKHLTMLCQALGRLSELESLFHLPAAGSIAELEARNARPKRERGSL